MPPPPIIIFTEKVSIISSLCRNLFHIFMKNLFDRNDCIYESDKRGP